MASLVIELDTRGSILWLPQDKLQELLGLLRRLVDKKLTLQDLQSILGT